jgi:hypothetical protein
LPAARAGAISHDDSWNGKFQGRMAPTTPTGCRSVNVKALSRSCSVLPWILVAQPGVVAKDLGGERDLDLPGTEEGLAGAEALELGHLVEVLPASASSRARAIVLLISSGGGRE